MTNTTKTTASAKRRYYKPSETTVPTEVILCPVDGCIARLRIVAGAGEAFCWRHGLVGRPAKEAK